jgi:hypothetical protein
MLANGPKRGFNYTIDSLPTRTTGSWAHHLLERLAADKRQAQDPDYQAKLKAAVATPINVVLMTAVFWQVTAESTRGCTVDGVPLDCRITNDTSRVSQHCAAAGTTIMRHPTPIAAACTTL